MQVVRELAASTGVNGMVGGQTLELEAPEVSLDPETLRALHEYSTGTLIGASARIGAILSGADVGDREAVSRYALNLGLCRKILDDILEATGESGCAPSGTASFVGVYGLTEARRRAEQAFEDSLGSLAAIDADTSGLEKLASLVRHHSG